MKDQRNVLTDECFALVRENNELLRTLVEIQQEHLEIEKSKRLWGIIRTVLWILIVIFPLLFLPMIIGSFIEGLSSGLLGGVGGSDVSLDSIDQVLQMLR